ncbi:unnamed protein product [Cuscuta europaea]|uniref:Uncharacterized protein n=1 Tax=Cuscuta europaea TaxID=41803 RepID=A0A9P1EMH7_CUSEU|nr:unnamed protein product [Cuscuta europaea]
MNEYKGKSVLNTSDMEEFNDFIFANSLSDLNFQGTPFTWMGNRMNGLVFKKLDRVMASNELFQLNRNLTLKKLNKFVSDHNPLLLQENPVPNSGPKSFRF